jgi:misacylated tRNA(Ala) deacylase
VINLFLEAMTELLYLDNHYLKEFDSTVTEIRNPTSLVLDRTAVYPRGGGQPSDRGVIILQGTSIEIVESSKADGAVVHQLSRQLTVLERESFVGKTAHVSIDWDLRYKHMRHHTALHILSGVVYHRYGAKITGGQIYADRARMDLSIPDLGKDLQLEIESTMNEVVKENREVRAFWINTEEALKKPELYRLSADLLPKGLEKLRIVDIVGFDAQLDGGTHVARTGEIGKIKISKAENKGKDNKRLEIVLS